MARDYPSHGVPVNKLAAMVISRGERHEMEYADRNTYENPPILLPSPSPEGVPNLIGYRNGRIEVIGYAGRRGKRPSGGSRTLWLVRCDCGRYEFRRNRSIKKAKRHRDINQCNYCDARDEKYGP
jgi:hypothetical protein